MTISGPLDPGVSLFLDLTRVLAAFAVVLHRVFKQLFYDGPIHNPARHRGGGLLCHRGLRDRLFGRPSYKVAPQCRCPLGSHLSSGHSGLAVLWRPGDSADHADRRSSKKGRPSCAAAAGSTSVCLSGLEPDGGGPDHWTLLVTLLRGLVLHTFRNRVISAGVASGNWVVGDLRQFTGDCVKFLADRLLGQLFCITIWTSRRPHVKSPSGGAGASHQSMF